MATKTTYKKTTDAQIFVGPGVLKGFAVHTDGAATGQLELHDCAAAVDATDANQITDWTVVGAAFNSGRNFGDDGLTINDGLYANITGANAFYFIEYESKSRS